MSDGFPSVAFQSSFSIASILFGVFGFLYTLYGIYKPQITPTNLQHMPIVPRLRTACRVIVFFIVLDTTFTVYSVVVMWFSGSLPSIHDKILAAGLGGTIFLIALISIVGVIWHMD